MTQRVWGFKTEEPQIARSTQIQRRLCLKQVFCSDLRAPCYLRLFCFEDAIKRPSTHPSLCRANCTSHSGSFACNSAAVPARSVT